MAADDLEHHELNQPRFNKTSVALRTMAMFEVTKAATVLVFACGLFHLMHENLDDVAKRVVQMLHVNPEGKLSNLFVELANHSSDRNLWVLALGSWRLSLRIRLSDFLGFVTMLHGPAPGISRGGAPWVGLGTVAYASVRLTEAYGLWREREWAQWFSLLSTALYLPPELYWMLGYPSWLKCAVLVSNIVIFLFMLSLCVYTRSRVARRIRLQSPMRTGDPSPAGSGSRARY